MAKTKKRLKRALEVTQLNKIRNFHICETDANLRKMLLMVFSIHFVVRVFLHSQHSLDILISRVPFHDRQFVLQRAFCYLIVDFFSLADSCVTNEVARLGNRRANFEEYPHALRHRFFIDF